MANDSISSLVNALPSSRHSLVSIHFTAITADATADADAAKRALGLLQLYFKLKFNALPLNGRLFLPAGPFLSH
ncbi:hypothetical protein TYRP_010892 [Tyrophagus putrescentiae]|nr:hypothetical protein TYRP_010892 [Tyrophagus putrescentiae]